MKACVIIWFSKRTWSWDFLSLSLCQEINSFTVLAIRCAMNYSLVLKDGILFWPDFFKFIYRSERSEARRQSRLAGLDSYLFILRLGPFIFITRGMYIFAYNIYFKYFTPFICFYRTLYNFIVQLNNSWKKFVILCSVRISVWQNTKESKAFYLT